MKIAAISLSPMPYNTPVFNALATTDDLHVIYLCKEDRISRFANGWGTEPTYPHSFFRSRSLYSELVDLQLQLALGTSRRLAQLRPDVVLVVSWKPVTIEPLLWARCSGRGTVMWSESTSFSGLFRGGLSTQLRKSIVHHVDSFVTNGSQATEYLRTLGARSDRIVTSRLPGTPAVALPSAAPRPDPEGIRFLYVGRLIPRKRPLELIQTFARVGKEAPTATLTIVGQGELEQEVRDAAARVPGVRYAGFSEGEALSSLYLGADVLVLPALREVWGLVVNEAIAHGLFVIATDEVGSAHDLLNEESGVMVSANDLEQVAREMIAATRNLDTSHAARLQRAAVVSDCTPARFSADIRASAELALQVRRTKTRRAR